MLQVYAEWQEMPGLDVRGKSFLLQDTEGRSQSRQEQQDTSGSHVVPCAVVPLKGGKTPLVQQPGLLHPRKRVFHPFVPAHPAEKSLCISREMAIWWELMQKRTGSHPPSKAPRCVCERGERRTYVP